MSKRTAQCAASVDALGRPYIAAAGVHGPSFRCKRKAHAGSYCKRCTEAYEGDRGFDLESHEADCDYVHGVGPCDCGVQ